MNREAHLAMQRDVFTVAIIDADDAARRATQRLLESVGIRARGFADAGALLATQEADRAHCIVADVFLPGVSGLDLLDKLARQPYHPPVILLAASADIPVAVEAMRRGALDFLEKPYRPEAFLARVHQAFRHDEAARRTYELRRLLAARAARLTPREREVLFLAGAGLTSQAIATRLGVTRKAIESHRGKAMQKLEVKSPALLARVLAVLTGDVAGPLFEHEEKRGSLPTLTLGAVPSASMGPAVPGSGPLWAWAGDLAPPSARTPLASE